MTRIWSAYVSLWLFSDTKLTSLSPPNFARNALASSGAPSGSDAIAAHDGSDGPPRGFDSSSLPCSLLRSVTPFVRWPYASAPVSGFLAPSRTASCRLRRPLQRRAIARMIERDYPRHIKIEIPDGGLGSRLNTMRARTKYMLFGRRPAYGDGSAVARPPTTAKARTRPAVRQGVGFDLCATRLRPLSNSSSGEMIHSRSRLVCRRFAIRSKALSSASLTIFAKSTTDQSGSVIATSLTVRPSDGSKELHPIL